MSSIAINCCSVYTSHLHLLIAEYGTMLRFCFALLCLILLYGVLRIYFIWYATSDRLHYGTSFAYKALLLFCYIWFAMDYY